MLKVLTSPGLIYYFKKQMHEATATTPRLPEWSDDQYFKACQAWADEHGKSARDRGGDFHDVVQRFHLACMEEGPTKWNYQGDEFRPQMEAYMGWYHANVKQTLLVEQPVKGEGYAGRLDHCCVLLDGRMAVTDVKTQAPKNGRFNTYVEWSEQLGAYGGALDPMPDCLISVVVSSTEPVILQAHVWERPVSYYHQLFLGLLAHWRAANDFPYEPTLPFPSRDSSHPSQRAGATPSPAIRDGTAPPGKPASNAGTLREPT